MSFLCSSIFQERIEDLKLHKKCTMERFQLPIKAIFNLLAIRWCRSRKAVHNVKEIFEIYSKGISELREEERQCFSK